MVVLLSFLLDGTYNGQVSGYHIWEVYQGAFGTEAGWSFKTESK